MKCAARYLELNAVQTQYLGSVHTSELAASVDCNDLIDKKLWKVYWKRGNETMKNEKFNNAYKPCMLRRMRLDDKARTLYIQREAVKGNNVLLPDEVKAYVKVLMDNAKKLEKKHYNVCEAMKGKY